MRPFALLNAAKVLFLAISLSTGATDFSVARDIDQSSAYRFEHRDRHDRLRPILSGKNRDRHVHDRRAEQRHGYRHDRRWRADKRRHDVVREYRRNPNRLSLYGGDDFPSPVPKVGTYAGGISAWRDPGNGIYFSRNDDGYGYGDVNVDVDLGNIQAGPKILDVEPAAVDRSCSYEKGVCVIRRR